MSMRVMSMNSPPPCVPTNGFQLSDFQGHILAVANANPVTSIRPNGNPGPLQQQWSWVQTPTGTTGTLVSAVAGNPVLAWNTANGRGNPSSVQPIVASNTTLQLEVTCLGTTIANIADLTAGVALSSWPAQVGDTNNPVTFEPFDMRVQQNWTFIPLASLD